MKLLKFLATKLGHFFHDLGVTLLFFGHYGAPSAEAKPKAPQTHEADEAEPYDTLPHIKSERPWN